MRATFQAKNAALAGATATMLRFAQIASRKSSA
jgi:hypothetical protein